MMKPYRLRQDLTRNQLGEYALPLGIVPVDLAAPRQGYTVTYTPGEEDTPDSYSFHVVVSHERASPLIHRAFDLLSDSVFGIIEIGSRDAYRTTDVYVGEQPIDRRGFIETWKQFEDFLLEDGSIGAGANCDDPFIEVFVDQWKGIAIHVPLALRDDVEQLLGEFDLEEVNQTWPDELPSGSESNASELRPVLSLDDDYSPGVDELLLQLRHNWQLVLDIEPDVNKDESGRELGLTIWHVVMIVQSREDEDQGAYISIWLTAASANEVGRLVNDVLDEYEQWETVDVYSFDRVAYDDRPEELSDLPPRPEQSAVHHVEFETWSSSPAAD